jgi:hypothetical protein
MLFCVADLTVEPPLSPAEREIVKNYGGWTQFLLCFGLKPWNSEDVDEAMQILRTFTHKEEN